ncbi:MAG TPA: tRNA (adenosine(37)-N6)-threonylcarbamoyltransferase complex transferase subunit TsaD [Candidatus Poseidoniaceae archaeon]|nr:MAG TPA: tRNA (adenosine(37)-N6)-threonylcarbamoyltransferase complex transferase subunit TsaD [Candidatus Poseidoniales archaeon]HIH53670.1 tRNA (adenosine(37)-N6)-threonylcarbamoyltransferase complex transferase subunit TsaD [Candidatus Poseidoniaceae archaeon]
MDGWILGLESTAHTLSYGAVLSNGQALPAATDTIRPTVGGIHPREAADHHRDVADNLLTKLLEQHELSLSNLGGVAFSQGPGMGPCLQVGAGIARALAAAHEVPLIGVNHCVAHIEIGRSECDCDDPVLLYVSGGNTQVITRLDGRYRVLGETLDIGIGNMLDKFARKFGHPFPGGPVIEQHARAHLDAHPNATLDGLELPYAVRGMDMAFSGLMTAAVALVQKGAPFDAVCWSLQEHAFAACVEVAERAMAHSGKHELLLGGGVACNQRLRDMCTIMAKEREGSSHAPPRIYCIDNGTMIAQLGWLELGAGRTTSLNESAVDPGLRTDATPIAW